MDLAEVRVHEIIAALADLSPQSPAEKGAKRQIPLEWFRWMPLSAVQAFAVGALSSGYINRRPGQSAIEHLQDAILSNPPDPLANVPLDRDFAERLAAIDQIRASTGSVRLGWLFLAGRTTDESGKVIRVFEPLVTLKVRVGRSILESRLTRAGDVEINPLVVDPDGALEGGLYGALPDVGFTATSDVGVSAALLNRMPHLQRVAADAALSAGLVVDEMVPALESPTALMKREGLVVVAGVGIYVDQPSSPITRASTLGSWDKERKVDVTALRHLYLGSDQTATSVGSHPPDASSIESPFLLTPRQREAVLSSATAPITLVSGAPGTGKSHTVVAMAVDAVARGQRVLIATRTDATVDALLDLLERAPGPDPVVFGSNERREALITRLTSGQLRPTSEGEIRAAGDELRAAVHERDAARAELVDHLQVEALAEGHAALGTATLVDQLFTADLGDIRSLLAAAQEPGGWFARRRRRTASAQLAAQLGLDVASLSLAEVAESIGIVEERRADGLSAPAVTESDARWTRLLGADDRARRAFGHLVDLSSRSSDRLDRRALVSLTNLATALRSGRSARRAQLARLTGSDLTRALPLWVGTLADIDDLLPPKAGLFDLVILDEASSIDQPLAAPALLRATRAVIVGDPKQLRHVSFLSDDRIQSVLSTHLLDGDPELASLLDVRRNSIFDVAASAVPVLQLDEQFRSDPHLVDFVAKRLYGGAMHVATRTPRTESVDCVDVERVEGKRNGEGVVQAEVAAVIVNLRRLLRTKARSVGVVTPFRAQADAIEEAVLAAFSADDVEALDLRVGTVHAMQGNERDVVIASMGIGPDDKASWRFVEDSHLFTVLVTRARRSFLVLLSAEPPSGGLVADYLAQADAPPRPSRSAREIEPWIGSIARGIELAGVQVVTPYAAGRHLLDACVGDDIDFLGIESRVHPDGVDAHIDRHLSLRRSGWRLVEAFESRWASRTGELVIEIDNQLQCRRTPR